MKGYQPTEKITPSFLPKGGSSADKKSITIYIEVINDMANTIIELENKIDFICGQLAKDFGPPCNFSPIYRIMPAICKCEKNCKNISKSSECWRRYFEEVQRKSEQ